jgi:hypothetical protein
MSTARRDAVEAGQLVRQTGMAVGEVYGAATEPQHLFTFGLERVLDGIERLIESRAAQRDSP